MNFIKKFLGGKRGTLLKNTVMLYILQFSTYLLALLVTPYETRVLDPDMYGYLQAATSIIIYFQLIIDFGFLLSATEEVSRERNDKGMLCKIFTSVTYAKIFLAAGSFVVLFVLCQVIPAWRDKELVLILTFFASFINSLMPDFLYRGLEKMSAITIRTVLIKLFFTCAIFVFLKEPDDVWVVPALNIVGNSVALIFTYFHVIKKLDISFKMVKVRDVVRQLKNSSFFFFSRIATTAYTSLNTVILDIIKGGGATVGYYTSANNLITAGKNGLSPISDSLYPYMAKHKDFKLVKKVMLVAEPVIFVFCAVIFVIAEPFCAWFFGEDFREAGNVLRAMLPVGVIIFPSYVFGFPVMTAMGISKHANYSTIFGSVFHVLLLGVLFITGNVNMMSLAISVSATETVILAYRLIVVFKNRHLMKPQNNEERSKS